MKKCLILFTVLTLILCGCGNTENAENLTVPTNNETAPTIDVTEPAIPDETALPEEPEVVYTQQPMVAVSMPLCTEYVNINNIPVYYYTYQDIYLNVQDQQVADTIIIDYLNRREQNHSIAQSLAQNAENAFNGSESWNPYFFESIYSPTRADLGVLSLFGHNAIYTGGHHPELECMAANYNMITGEVLTLGSILRNEDCVDTLCALVTENAAALKDTYPLFDDYQNTIQTRFAREASYDEDWFFTANGLCFFFAPYEIAPYTSGIITVEIPYSDLAGSISDEFFPSEADDSKGVIQAVRLIDADIETFTQIADVPLSEDGEQIFLYCEGIPRNIHLDFGVWNESGTVFTKQATVFASYLLSPGDGIVITTDIPDTMPALRLSYDSGSEHIDCFISQSGKDGSILLLDNIN